jgi:hypothetical protein
MVYPVERPCHRHRVRSKIPRQNQLEARSGTSGPSAGGLNNALCNQAARHSREVNLLWQREAISCRAPAQAISRRLNFATAMVGPEGASKGPQPEVAGIPPSGATLVPNIESNEPFIMDGWVSLEGSPLLAHDTASTIAPGLNSQVGSVASIFISRWEVAILSKVPEELNNRLAMAIAGRIDKAGLYPIAKPPPVAHILNVGTREDRGEIDFSKTLSAGRQQRTKTNCNERKNYYAEQSRNANGLQIGQS